MTHRYEGPIEPGMRFSIWAPDRADSRRNITITRIGPPPPPKIVRPPGAGGWIGSREETVVWSKADDADSEVWHEFGEFRVAAFPIGGRIPPDAAAKHADFKVGTITAPWTWGQVAMLNRYQKRGDMHPYTCEDSSHGALVAAMGGWVCRECGYRQNWAHSLPPVDKERADKFDYILRQLESGNALPENFNAVVTCWLLFPHLKPATPESHGGKYGYSSGSIETQHGFLMAHNFTGNLSAALEHIPQGWICPHMWWGESGAGANLTNRIGSHPIYANGVGPTKERAATAAMLRAQALTP
jgi:hypothetical protein